MASQPVNRTEANREQLVLLCEVRQGVRPWAMARLEDLSAEGFRIAWMPDCDPDKPIRIRIPGLQLLSAGVRWQQGKAVGCAFAEPLHVAVFESIVRTARTDFA
jgi:PilZ domain